MEIGGTSCDVMLMSAGDVPVTEDLVVGGYHLATPSVAVHTIGAGGGTIAHVDDGGLLVVGPAGAGADPGPAAYGRGGSLPTVTDAQLVLGRLQPGPYADGAIVLDAGLAATAIEHHVALPLGLDVETAAAGIIRLLEQHLLQAVERITLERGRDPRRLTLVAAGGAGPMHGCSVGRALGCRHVLVPRLAGAFCAVGMLHSDVRHDLTSVATGRLDETDRAALTERFDAMVDEGRERLTAGGFESDDCHFDRSVELRYPGQQASLRVSASGDVRAAFEALYESLYGHVQPGGVVEITGLHVAAIGRLPAMARPHRQPAAAPPSPFRRQRMWIDPDCGHAEVPVYRGADLAPGHTVPGPAIVEERTTTVVVLPGDTLCVTPGDDLLISLGGCG
jgi:N-methylhydantoinase A